METYGKSFKELSARKKAEHIWEYYRWHIFAAIAGVIILTSIIVTVLTPEKEYSVNIVVAGKILPDETQDKVIEKFEKEFDTKLNLAMVDFSNIGQMELVMMQKIPLQVRNKELDILVLSKDAYMSYLEQGGDMFMPLDTIEEMKPLLESKKDSLITTKDIHVKERPDGSVKPLQSDGKNHIYGIEIKGLKNVPCVTVSEDLIVGITSGVKDIPKTVNMLNYIVK